MERMKKIIALIAIGIFCSTSAFAIEGGNPKKGKHLYKQNCKSCHSAGGEGGELTPLSKTMAQWDRFFEKDKHQAKPEVLEKLNEKDIKDINQFLYDHAADSDQPQTCG